jgi:DNA-binding response OmpR family regulator
MGLSALIRKKLLILDDNGSFAESLADVISHQGFEVQWASQVAKARTLARSFLPDVLIVDINLVTTSGIEVAEQFARESLANGFVFLTGSVDMDQTHVPEPLKGKAVVLHKPVAKEDLLEAIEALSGEASGVSKTTDSTPSQPS